MIERISPLWIGIGISGSLIVILLATETLLGRWDALLVDGEFDALAYFSNRVLRDIRLAIVLCLVAGGILEKFPRLKVAFMEAGAGWVPYWMERLDEHYEYLQPTVPWLIKPPSEYMRGDQVYYSFEPDEHTLGFTLDFVGEERLVFASDYNHIDSKFPHTVETVTKREEISKHAMAKIMGENAARLYSL